jgi:6-phosphofructokinase 1
MGTNANRTVALACSGGDAPGTNAFIRAFVQLAINEHDAVVLAIKNGFGGLNQLSQRVQAAERTIVDIQAEVEVHAGLAGLHRRGQVVVRLDRASVRDLVGQGGTILGAGRCVAVHDANVRRRVIDLLVGLGVDAVVIVGGEGSLAAARLVAESCLTVVGVPATIDHDTLQHTETSLGFDTAVSNAVWAVKRYRDTARSHGRILVLETMGRNSGRIAEAAALAGGADIAVIPEQGPLTGSKVVGIARRIERGLENGLSHAIVVIAEGVELSGAGPMGAGEALTAALRAYFQRPCTPVPESEVRLCVLGHPQRSGPPTVDDRLLAARYAEAASWAALGADPPRSGVVGLREGRFVLQRFDEPASPEPSSTTTREHQLHKMLGRS